METGGQVKVRALMQFTMQRDLWESAYAWYTPRGQYANFIVFENLPGFYYHWEPRALVHTVLRRPGSYLQHRAVDGDGVEPEPAA